MAYLVDKYQTLFEKTGMKIDSPAENTSYKRQTKKIGVMMGLLKEAKLLLEAKENAYHEDHIHMKNNLLQKIMAVVE